MMDVEQDDDNPKVGCTATGEGKPMPVSAASVIHPRNCLLRYFAGLWDSRAFYMWTFSWRKKQQIHRSRGILIGAVVFLVDLFSPGIAFLFAAWRQDIFTRDPGVEASGGRVKLSVRGEKTSSPVVSAVDLQRRRPLTGKHHLKSGTSLRKSVSF